MTRQFTRVTVRPWHVGYVYIARLGDHDVSQPRGNDYSSYRRQGWRLTRSGVERYIRRSYKRRRKRIDFHTRHWTTLELERDE